MRTLSRSNLPELPEFPRRKSKEWHWARWLILIGVAFAALAWKQRSVRAPGISTSDESPDDPTADVSSWVDAIESDNQTIPETTPGKNSSNDPVPEPVGISTDADQGEPVTTQAGTDAQPASRSIRVERDPFGVVMTDAAPVGLNGEATWVRGDGLADCPEAYPIKGNASSRIYHRPGESSYEKTIPEFCFASEEDAKAAGYRPRAR